MAKLSSPLQKCGQIRRALLTATRKKFLKNGCVKKSSPIRTEKQEWDDALCPVCLEFPHNAVLLLCSSYANGCRPYMCATSYRFSHCLEQYKKAYTRPADDDTIALDGQTGPTDVLELPCPLCRGRVKGWTVVDPARKYLNRKKRACMQEECSFAGTYKKLRKHVKADHPWARPRAVDPVLEEKWKRLEHEREMEDVMSTISASMPGSVVLGDYVIEGNFHRIFRDGFDTALDGFEETESRSHVHRILQSLPFLDELGMHHGRRRFPMVRLRRRRRHRQSRRLIVSLE